jgi:subtilisin-like proprotein convertase family protein
VERDRRDRRRRHLFLLGLACLATALVVAQPLAAAAPRAERKKSQTVSRTFSNTTPIAIVGQGPASPYSTEIDISGFRRGRVKDVNLRLRGFSHEFPDDVDILLVAPDGRSSMMMSDAGGVDEVFDIDLTLDDQAPSPLSNEGTIRGGNFQPVDFERDVDTDIFPPPAPDGLPNVGLSVFNGDNPNGTWSLFVSDDAPSDDGSIVNGWELTIRAEVVKGGKGKGKGKGKRR